MHLLSADDAGITKKKKKNNKIKYSLQFSRQLDLLECFCTQYTRGCVVIRMKCMYIHISI